MRDSVEETVELPTDAGYPEEPPAADGRAGEPRRVAGAPNGATEPLGTRGRARSRSGFWAELSGALAIGLAALAAVVLVFQIVAWAQGIPGPGLLTVAGHVVAAGLALLAQRFADRRGGWRGAAAVLGVLTVSAVALWLFWWA